MKQVILISKKIVTEVLIIGIIVIIINLFFYQLCVVHGKSMYPTLKDKQLVIIKKYDLNIKNNDIVVIKKNKKIIIKRVIGIPNDSINIDDYVYVNGIKIDDLEIDEKGNITDEFRLNENQYFVLGDNRKESIDSRFDEIGLIKKDEIIGKVIFK